MHVTNIAISQVKEGYSVMDGLKTADNSIGVISETVGTPIKKAQNQVDKLVTESGVNSEAESTSSHHSSQVLLGKNLDVEDQDTSMNRNSIEYIDKSEINDTKGEFGELDFRPVQGGPMIASTEDIKDIDSEMGQQDMKVLRRMKKKLYVNDLSMKLKDPTKTKSVYQKSQLYLGVLFLVSIYYSLPVLQMVFRYFI